MDFLRILRICFAGNGYCRASVPASVPKPTRSLPQISVAHDIITVEDAAGLVAAQFRGHSLGNSSPDHVPDCCSAEVVRDIARAPGGRSGAPPCVVEPVRRDATAGEVPQRAEFRHVTVEEHVLDDHLLLPLNLVSQRPLPLQELVQFRGEVEHPSLTVLRGPRVEPDLADAEIHLPPLERQHLAVDPPAGTRTSPPAASLRAGVPGPLRTAPARRRPLGRCPRGAARFVACDAVCRLPPQG